MRSSAPSVLYILFAIAAFPWPVMAQSPGHLLISEFRTRGPAGGNDEFIEIYNPLPIPLDISGFKVMGSSSSGSTSPRVTFPDGTVIGGKGYLLLVNVASGGYSGSVPGDFTYTTGIADNGGIAIVDPDENVIDAVGMSTGSAYKEGNVLPQTTVNKDQSYKRKTAFCGPDQDTDDNASDFEYQDGFSTPTNSSMCEASCECINPTGQCLAVPGECVADKCEYTVPSEAGTLCDDGDPCTFEDACTEDGTCEGLPMTCNTPPNDQCFEPQGHCEGGECIYEKLEEGTACDDGNPCTLSDACNADGLCLGEPLSCPSKPAECVDERTSRVYYNGTCNVESGDCEYAFTDFSCEFGCDGETGLCQNDPCAGVICESPPNFDCYEAGGECVQGECVYVAFDVGYPCDDKDPCTISDACTEDHECRGVPLECNTPPNDQCYEREGLCVEGSCLYEPKPQGQGCDDQNPCTDLDECDSNHECKGTPIQCPVPGPICESDEVSRIYLSASCDPADGQCKVSDITLDCGSLGCDETYGTCNRLPVISQVRTRGPLGGNDEFIELYNPSAFSIDIGGFVIMGSSKGPNPTITPRATIPSGTIMAPRTFYLLANKGSGSGDNHYSGTVEPDLEYSVGISDEGGVALLDRDGEVVDAVGFSALSGYVEGTPLAPTPNNLDQAYVRLELGCGPDRDLNDNATDFVYVTNPTPRNSKSCRLECAGEACVNPPPDRCKDDYTLETYEGKCSEGLCTYDPVDIPCDFGCKEGQCQSDPCEGVVCNNPPNTQCFEVEGFCMSGECFYTKFEAGTECDDGDLCTEGDKCDAAGKCEGTPVICPNKQAECADENTSIWYGPGTCDKETGECVYELYTSDCEFGCDEASGLCLHDPCAGVLCDQPPGPCYLASGQCVDGECLYEPLAKGASCDDGDPCTVEDQCDGEGKCVGTPVENCGAPEATPDVGLDGGQEDLLAEPSEPEPSSEVGLSDQGGGEDKGYADVPTPPDTYWPGEFSGEEMALADAFEAEAFVTEDVSQPPKKGGGGGCSAPGPSFGSPPFIHALGLLLLGFLGMRRRPL